MNRGEFDEKYGGLMYYLKNMPSAIGSPLNGKMYPREKLWEIIENIQSMPLEQFTIGSSFVSLSDIPEFFSSISSNPDLMVQYRGKSLIFTNFVINTAQQNSAGDVPRTSYLILDIVSGQRPTVTNIRGHWTGITIASLKMELRGFPQGWRVWNYSMSASPKTFINWTEDPFEEVKG